MIDKTAGTQAECITWRDAVTVVMAGKQTEGLQYYDGNIDGMAGKQAVCLTWRGDADGREIRHPGGSGLEHFGR